MKKFVLILGGIIGIISSFSLAFGNIIGLNNTIELGSIISKNIFLDSPLLNTITIAYRSDSDISNYTFSSACKTKTSYVWKDNDFYFFKLSFLDKTCNKPYTYLKNWGKAIPNSWFSVNFINDASLYTILLDLNDENVEKIKEKYKNIAKKLMLYNNLKEENIKVSDLGYLVKKRSYQEGLYKKGVIENIINKRQEKYTIPLLGYNLPTRIDKMPNSPRPYRADTTDGVHHSWDIDTPFWETTIALDDGIIIRIVDTWKKEDLTNIKKWSNLTEEEKSRNLDILRGNQVWIKTMKGELVMYAHLDTINTSIKEGMFVEKETPFWTVWASGVPEEWYNDYHLDFAIYENPYILTKAGKYDLDDYMKWDWKMKGKEKDYVLEHQYDFFLNK
jgi:murein DD-endopeptidase MepM/ murein hydrolase activator NlpD